MVGYTGMQYTKNIISIVGWAGTITLILAYTLNSFGIIPSTGLLYPTLNIIAAILLGIRVYADKNWSNLFLEFFWFGVAVISVIKYFLS